MRFAGDWILSSRRREVGAILSHIRHAWSDTGRPFPMLTLRRMVAPTLVFE